MPEFRGFTSPPPAPPPPRRARIRSLILQALAAVAILVAVALVVGGSRPASPSWSAAARPVIASLTNDIAAAHQDIAGGRAVAPDVRAALVIDLGRAHRVGSPAVSTVATDWSDALSQLSAALRAPAMDPFLTRARQDLLAVGQVIGP